MDDKAREAFEAFLGNADFSEGSPVDNCRDAFDCAWQARGEYEAERVKVLVDAVQRAAKSLQFMSDNFAIACHGNDARETGEMSACLLEAIAAYEVHHAMAKASCPR